MGIFLIIMGILILLIFIEWIEGIVSKFKKQSIGQAFSVL